MRSRWIIGLAALAAFVSGPAVTASAQASVSITTAPRHLVAPATDAFIVRSEKTVPSTAKVHLLDQKKPSSYTMKLKKVAKHAWAGSVYVAVPGRLAVNVYDGHGRLMEAEVLPVAKAKVAWTSRIIIGAILIVVALWYWRRMQRFTSPDRRRYP